MRIEMRSNSLVTFPWWVTWCLLASGAASLMYEVVWSRMLSLFIGSTGYAHSAVITAFMTGLACGSYILGRWSAKFKSPLLIYALLEVILGVYAASTPFLFPYLQELYGQFAADYGIVGYQSQLLRYFISLLALLIPTFLMGGTLPLLVEGLADSVSLTSKTTARLYGLNTIGAMFGTFVGGYFLIPIVGLKMTIFIAVSINFLVGLVVVLNRRTVIFRNHRNAKKQKISNRKSRQTKCNTVGGSQAQISLIDMRAMLFGFALSGFTAMLYQLIWIKSLVLIIGGSVQAFTIILTTYLAGIGFGAFLWSRKDTGQSIASMLRVSGVLQSGVAISSLLGLAGLRYLPEVMATVFASGAILDYTNVQILIFLFSFCLVLVPTLLMGLVFPMISGGWARYKQQVGQGIGTAYAVNAVGTIAGASVGGLLIIPSIGIEKGLFLAAALSVLIGAIFWLIGSREIKQRTRQTGVCVIVLVPILIGVLMPRWDNLFMQSGAYMYGAFKQDAELSWFDHTRADELLYYAEGVDAVVSVVQGSQRYLKVNGKTDASSKSDLATQLLLGHIPMMMHPKPQAVLQVGLGSGVTAGAMSLYHTLAALDVVELSDKVIAASDYFTDVNNHVLLDPRTTVYRADVRNYLHANNKAYDVIMSQVSNPWQSGNSKMFTQQYYELLKRHLAQGGVAAQWVNIYSMSENDVATVIATFQRVFPQLTIWRPTAGDLLMVGSMQPVAMQYARVQKLMSETQLAESLAHAKVGDLTQFMGLLLGPASSFPNIQQYPRINTDNLPYVEYSAHRYLYRNTINQNLKFLMSNMTVQSFRAPIDGLLVNNRRGINAELVGLKVRNTAPSNDLSSHWIADRKLVQQPNKPAKLAVRNRVISQWSEADGHYQIMSTLPAENPKGLIKAELNLSGMLSAALKNAVWRQGSMGNLKLGVVYWALGPSPSTGSPAIVIAWLCPSKNKQESPFVHVATQSSPRLQSNDTSEIVGKFIERFECATL
jgi:spermidine synthase